MKGQGFWWLWRLWRREKRERGPYELMEVIAENKNKGERGKKTLKSPSHLIFSLDLLQVVMVSIIFNLSSSYMMVNTHTIRRKKKIKRERGKRKKKLSKIVASGNGDKLRHKSFNSDNNKLNRATCENGDELKSSYCKWQW
jgi:hypothetical protein